MVGTAFSIAMTIYPVTLIMTSLDTIWCHLLTDGIYDITLGGIIYISGIV